MRNHKMATNKFCGSLLPAGLYPHCELLYYYFLRRMNQAHLTYLM